MAYNLTQSLPDIPKIDVVDVGSSLHKTNPRDSYDFQPLLDIGKARVIGFEGDENRANAARDYLGADATVLQRMIGDGEPAVFHENAFSLTSSLFASNLPLIERIQQLAEAHQTTRTFDVETCRLDDCAEIGNVDALFIDTQGAELQIITHASKALKSALVVQLEVWFLPIYHDIPTFGDIDAFMRSKGFMFHTFFRPGLRTFKPVFAAGDPSQGLRQWIWADAVYMRDLFAYDELSNVQLMKLALMMQDLYKSTDVSYQALAEIDRRDGTTLAPDFLNQLIASQTAG